MSDTSSFRELEAGWQDRLQWLHDDYYYRRQVRGSPPPAPLPNTRPGAAAGGTGPP